MSNYSSTILGTSGLVHYYRMNETSGTTMVDASGASNGTYVPGFPTSTTGALTTSGDNDTAISFNGTSQYATFSRAISADFTIEFWFKTSGGLGASNTDWFQGAGLVGNDVAGQANDFGTSIDANGSVWFGVGQSGASTVSIKSATGYNNNVWHHVAATRSQADGKFRLYLDGVWQATGTNSTGNLLNAASTVAIGITTTSTPANFLAGSIDEVATYTQAFNHTQVRQHYAAGLQTTLGSQSGPAPIGMRSHVLRPYCLLWNSTALSVVSGNNSTVVPFDTTIMDSDNMHSISTNTSRITINTAGVYVFTGIVDWAANATGERECHIRKLGSNSNFVGQNCWQAASANDTRITTPTPPLPCAVGDWFEVYVFQTSGVNLNINSTINNGIPGTPVFGAYMIGP